MTNTHLSTNTFIITLLYHILYLFTSDNMPYEKVGDNEPVCIADEVPFEIPDGWEWCRLSFANEIYTGNSINENIKKQKYTNIKEGYNYIGTKDVNFNNAIDYENGIKIPFNENGFRIANKNSVLLCIEGGSAGRKIAILNDDVCFGNKLCCFKQYCINEKFLYYYLQSNLFTDVFKENTTGIIGGVSVNTIKSLFLPLPPLQEQQRIVTEIEKYLPLINEYDKLQTELDTLDKEFPEKLKKSILQEAIKGKLVEQDKSEEPASVLLEKIRKEKEKLIKEGKIKKDKNESIIYKRDNSYYEKLNGVEKCIDDEIPFEIPESWEWCRLGSICLIERGGSPRPIKNYITDDKNGINWIKIGDTNKFDKYITKTNEKIIKEGIKHSRFVKKGDFLLTNSMSFGRPYILNIDGCIHDGWLVISNYEIVFDKLYLYWLLSSDYTHNNFCEIVSGAVVKNLNINKVSNSFFPIPPLNEQIRIVKKIEELFSIINN